MNPTVSFVACRYFGQLSLFLTFVACIHTVMIVLLHVYADVRRIEPRLPVLLGLNITSLFLILLTNCEVKLNEMLLMLLTERCTLSVNLKDWKR